MINNPKTNAWLDKLKPTMRGVVSTTALVGIVALCVFLMVEKTGLRYGSVVFLFPVVVAAAQWGLACALLAVVLGVLSAAFFFYSPTYTIHLTDPRELINLTIYTFIAIVTSHLAKRLREQVAILRQREIDLRDLYNFSRRLAVAFNVSDIHTAVEDHLSAVMQRKVVLFPDVRGAAPRDERRSWSSVPEQVLAEVADVASGRRDASTSLVATVGNGDVWLIRAVTHQNAELHVIAINLGVETKEKIDDLRSRVDVVLADAIATLERLGVAHAIGEANLRVKTDHLREALISSVSHELRTPLASILGAATVLSAAPALKNEKQLQTLVQDVRGEAERLNNNIQNLLDASRISSDGVKPHAEWTDLADVIHSAVERCRSRLAQRQFTLDLPVDLPLVHVDSVLVQQALVQIFDNAVKYSQPHSHIAVVACVRGDCLIVGVSDRGVGLTQVEHAHLWERFTRGERHVATISGSGLGLWIANAFIAANGGKISADSDGPGCGTKVTIELPVMQATHSQLESAADGEI